MPSVSAFSEDRRLEFLAMARAQLRAADLEDAGLFLQQTIEADLARTGVLSDNNYVAVTRGSDCDLALDISSLP